MKAIVLAGGYGTRLYPLTLRTPKPLLPLAGKPVLQHGLELLAQSRIREVIISLKESQRKMERFFGNGSPLGLRLTYVYEKDVGESHKMGSVGALAHVFSTVCEPCDCLVLGGDNFFYGLDLQELKRHHSKSKAHATLALFDLHAREDVKHFGVAELDENGRILHFQEKPSVEEAASKLASTAVYHLEEAFVREHLPKYVKLQHEKGKKADRMGDLWQHFANELGIFGYPFQGLWGDIGTPENYLQVNRQAMEFLEKTKPGSSHFIHPSATIASSAKIIPPVIIEKGCQISEKAVVGPYACILHDSVVESGARVQNSILFEKVHVGKNAVISEALLDGESKIGEAAVVSGFSVLGFRSRIGKKARVEAGWRVFPFMEVKDGVALKKDFVSPEQQAMKKLESSCYWL